MSAGVDITDELRVLGEERRLRRKEDAQAADDIRAAIVSARAQGLSMTEIAELLGIDRTQLYRTYT